MKIDLKAYGEKLRSKDSKVRLAAINELAQSEHRKEVEFLIGIVFKHRAGNALALAIRAVGNFQNKNAIAALIDGYENAGHDERELIMDCLLKLDVFSKFFPGDQTSKKIRERLWPVVFGLNTDQLKKVIELSSKEFEEELESGWRITKHWRK